jgi:hypothetical protein
MVTSRRCYSVQKGNKQLGRNNEYHNKDCAENPLKLDDHGYVRYHGSQIRKLKTLANGKLEDNPTAAV